MNITKTITEGMEQICEFYKKERHMESYLKKEMTIQNTSPKINCLDSYSNGPHTWDATITIIYPISRGSEIVPEIEKKIDEIFGDFEYTVEPNRHELFYSVRVKIKGEVQSEGY